MKKYEVKIQFESKEFIVQANNEDEAREKAIEIHLNSGCGESPISESFVQEVDEFAEERRLEHEKEELENQKVE